MGIQEKFLQNGSTFGAGQGGNSADLQRERDAIIGDKSLSKLHFDYSINGLVSSYYDFRLNVSFLKREAYLNYSRTLCYEYHSTG